MNIEINYCYDRNDGEILDRKRNLCKSGADCEYYYCEDGICNPSYSSCKHFSLLLFYFDNTFFIFFFVIYTIINYYL